MAQQYRQNLALLSGKVDLVVADRNIFQWYARDPRVTRTANARQPITYHDIFAPTPYRVGFRHAATRDAFDGALARLEASGRRDAILRAYTSAPWGERPGRQRAAVGIIPVARPGGRARRR